MSAPTPAPAWLNWQEWEVAGLTDAELSEYIAYWRQRGDHYRRMRRAVDADHPHARGWGYSGWQCSTRESIGIREAKRRRIRGEAGKSQ